MTCKLFVDRGSFSGEMQEDTGDAAAEKVGYRLFIAIKLSTNFQFKHHLKGIGKTGTCSAVTASVGLRQLQ